MRIIKEETSLPTTRVVVPYDVKISKYPDSQINKGAVVLYESYQLNSGFLIVLFYNKMKHIPTLFEKVPLIFDSASSAVIEGWNVVQPEVSASPINYIPSAG